jgi:hypothetical protein
MGFVSTNRHMAAILADYCCEQAIRNYLLQLYPSATRQSIDCLKPVPTNLTLLSVSASRNFRGGLIGLRIVKRVYFFQFTVADMHAVEDLIHAKDCLHFKDCCHKIPLDNMLLDLDAFDGWQNTRQECDDSVPPDQLSYPWPLKGNILGERYFGYVLSRQTSQIRLDNRDFFLS